MGVYRCGVVLWTCIDVGWSCGRSIDVGWSFGHSTDVGWFSWMYLRCGMVFLDIV